MTAVCVMVLGTTSGAGKSWVTTALCRHYAQQGLKVAPFKAQNMSNNARVVAPTLHRWRGSLPPEGADAPWGGPAAARPGPHAPPLRGSLPPEGVDAPWGGPAAAKPGPHAPPLRGSLPPEGGDAPWGGPAAHRGGEIGSAQYFQALAAMAEPEVRMNPLLLKPEADTRSQVVLLGEVDRELSEMPWRGRSEKVWPHIAAALDALRAENDVVVIEGAGSPAEINLHASDIVNMRVALHAQARCLLVTDIDRGGAFAHLYGTWALLPEDERALIKGFVLNKFRGDASLLAPAPQMLQELTGVPVVATLPMWWQHGLPEEDGVFDMTPTLGTGVSSLPPEGARFALGRPGGETMTGRGWTTIAVIAWPRISNLDEFQPLKNVPGVRLVWARSPADCVGADWIVLPGSKATEADLAWMRVQGLDAAVARHVAKGGAVLGICGGLQMLGEALVDTHGIDGNAPGLGLLPLVTHFALDKTVRRTSAVFGTLTGPWAALSGVDVTGYEIHHGQTAQHPAMAARGDIAREVMAGGLAWQSANGQVLGCYLHGLLEDPAVLRALFGARVPTLDSVFDGLADYLRQHVEPGVLESLIQKE